MWESGIRINTDVLYYCSPTPIRNSARRYLGLAAIATAGLSAMIVGWFAGLSTTIYTSWSACFLARLAASSTLRGSAWRFKVCPH